MLIPQESLYYFDKMESIRHLLLVCYFIFCGLWLINSSRIPRDDIRSKHPLLFDWTVSCEKCDSNLCEEIPSNCTSGIVRDACDCCYVCGNLEGTSCDLPNSEFRFGKCSEGLTCVAPPAMGFGANEKFTEGYCTCESSTVLCGSDGRTYINPCRYQRALARNPALVLRHEGPCHAAPLVDIPPMNQTAESSSSAVFSCTVSGFPFAWFEWLKDRENVFQPGISDDITVQIRSGPLKYQVTSWLEIKRSQPIHNGFYTCVAKNQLGEANASALLEVIDDEIDLANSYVFRGKHYQFTRNVLEDKLQSYHKTIKTSSTSNSELNENLERPNTAMSHVKVPSLRNESPNESSENLHVEDDISSPDSDSIEEVLVETLQDLVEPKTFKDIFFDDDDLSEGSSFKKLQIQ